MAALVTPTDRRARCGLSGSFRIWPILFALLLLGGLDLPAQTKPSREYQLKAVFLFNFAQFVEWPPEAFADAQAPLVIGVLGQDPFGAYLDDLVRAETVNNRPLTIQRYRGAQEIGACHVLFISRSESARAEQILAGLKGRNILTVSDEENFAARGGMIQFVTESNKIRLKINLEVVKATGLTVSSKLLRAAQIVTPGKK